MQHNTPDPSGETVSKAEFDSIARGLTTAEAERRRRVLGRNELQSSRKNPWIGSLRNIATEPMFLLLAVACVLYFFLGDFMEAMMMVVSIVFVAGIELIQETKSEKALAALRRYTRASVRTLRDGAWADLPSEELVPGDVVSLSEGERAPADGLLLEQHDLSADESVLTGESMPVEKEALPPDQRHFLFAVENETAIPSPSTVDRRPSTVHRLFQGTTIASGSGIFRVMQTGNRTEFGKLGKSIESIETAPTPLQVQIKRFVRNMGIVGGVAFLVVFGLNYWVEGDVWKALLFSLTLAMAILPEEIPVAFSIFMGLGAYRMIQFGILAKQPKTVESLGSATVICLDKTGTITENRMSVAEVADFSGQGRVLEYAFWSSEPEPFDAMEKAVMEAFLEKNKTDPRTGFSLVKEYALSGRPPMMTHIWENKTGKRIIACKGAVERVLAVSGADDASKKKLAEIKARTETLAERGYRVLGVASAEFAGAGFPADQGEFAWTFEGLVAFYDPPKENVAAVFQQFYEAGLRVLMITGDHAATAKNIARKTGLRGWEVAMTGQQVMDLDEADLRDAVQRVEVFARMFPEAKLRVVEALKANGETVAMSGDGVNDGPALKAAQIGVAMGKKGTDIAKSAASLVLLEDNLGGMVTALKMGRRIYDNLRKAIRYVISIHLPIVLTVLLPLLLGWPYPHILLPLHVIFLELVMDPTAAIAFENEPAEPNLLKKPPRAAQASLFSWPELSFSLLQGAVITAGLVFIYHFALGQGKNEAGVRAMVFTTLVIANLWLTLTNRSFDYPLHRTIFYKNRSLPLIIGASLAMLAAILYVPFFAGLFRVIPLGWADVGWCVLTGAASVWWFEVYKALKKH